jgi:hypothetical protein
MHLDGKVQWAPGNSGLGISMMFGTIGWMMALVFLNSFKSVLTLFLLLDILMNIYSQVVSLMKSFNSFFLFAAG